MNKKYLTTLELANLLGISRVAVFKKIKSGRIRAKKIGRNFFIEKNELGGILDESLTERKKFEISNAVEKIVKEYGETLKLLGKE